jgi:hypothetical protein
MTTEPTQPQPEMGSSPVPASGPAQDQRQGHRRRRRRRKNKPSQAAAPQQAQQGQAPKPQMQNQPQNQPQHASQSHQGDGGGGRRKKKKKKFVPNGHGGGRPRPEPGNSIAMQGQKRKNKQRGPREFVGPMDHSYRVANGNVADGPASTVQITNGGGGAYFPDLFDHTPVAPVREDAPTRIFCFIEDLFFLAKIQETARKLGVKVEFVKGDKEVIKRITDLAEADRPRLLVFDLNNANAKPMTLIPKFKTKFKKATSIIGFLSHLQGDLKLKATEAGCDTVMPRSAFSQSLPNLLRRYGMEEEEEYVPQPV